MRKQSSVVLELSILNAFYRNDLFRFITIVDFPHMMVWDLRKLTLIFVWKMA